MRGELLDYLSNKLKIYVCDLRLKTLRREIFEELVLVPEDRFTVEEWNYSLDYITGAQERFGTISQARIFVSGQLHRLRNNYG